MRFSINTALVALAVLAGIVNAQIHCEACCICDPICRNPCEPDQPPCCGPSETS
ncbi:hypothetical protein CALVIDRAFT_538586 [Calocera viscosa TUFC12733]|uniref:Uncharacterized protein n=1 Tax=Calocera viscosa (strain TUFC12733) TaxID=1330018 RepID=A0A167KMF3_CALVF|nr:hypothetical protein CALVIDRAFT_538586 [Calocera viscosa TUFC12733]